MSNVIPFRQTRLREVIEGVEYIYTVDAQGRRRLRYTLPSGGKASLHGQHAAQRAAQLGLGGAA